MERRHLAVILEHRVRQYKSQRCQRFSADCHCCASSLTLSVGRDCSLRAFSPAQAIDTGTSLIYLPQDLADSVYQQIPGARRAPRLGPGLYTYPCSNRLAVSLVFGIQSYAINLQDFNLGKTNASGR